MEKKKRIVYLDILRTIACLAVIMIHASANYVVVDIGSTNYFAAHLLDSIARVGVPLFVMISGALLLDKNYECTPKKLVKHIIRMVVFFIFWSAIYCLAFQVIYPKYFTHEQLSAIEIVRNFIKGFYHLWFIYLIIGLYLIVPLLRLWIKEDNKKYVEYFLILAFIFTSIIPEIITIGSNFINSFSVINDITENCLQLKYVGGYTCLFILGWYLNNFEVKNIVIYLLGIFGLLITFIGTYALSVIKGETVLLYGYLTINVILQSVAVFVFIKNRFKNTKENGNIIINSISNNSLGIYAIHAGLVYVMYLIIAEKGYVHAYINIPAMFIISFVISYIVTLIFSKIPLLKKLV